MASLRFPALYITICVVGFLTSKIIMAVLCYRRWQRKQKMVIQDNFSGGKLVIFQSPKTKTLKSKVLLKKTMRLSNQDIIGSGGYGTVYKLTMKMSNDSSSSATTSFAVKRLSRISAEQDRGFERELEAMADIKHRNIVPLHGYYTAPHYNLLIYELMPNGSLHGLLHGRSLQNKKVLDWPSRYKIAVGAARGISYLHHDCIPHIIHRDIKTSNILLDQNLEAKVSDFGLATLMEPDKTHVSTLVAGTFGYLPPEYFDTGKATMKGDVYSFGVVLLEILTGRKPTDETFIEEGTKLVTWVKAVVEDKREEYVVDSSLERYPADQVNQVFSIALMCLETEPSKRPAMSEVVKMLEQIKSYQIFSSELVPKWSQVEEQKSVPNLRNYRKLLVKDHFSCAANPLATEAFREGETGSLPRNTSKRADETSFDSIVASTAEGSPSDDTETCQIT